MIYVDYLCRIACAVAWWAHRYVLLHTHTLTYIHTYIIILIWLGRGRMEVTESRDNMLDGMLNRVSHIACRSNKSGWCVHSMPISQSDVLTKTASTLKPKLHVQQWSIKVEFNVSADEFKSKVPNPAFEVRMFQKYMYEVISIVTKFLLNDVVSIWTGFIPKAGYSSLGATWQCFCGCPHICWENCSGRICHCFIYKTQN